MFKKFKKQCSSFVVLVSMLSILLTNSFAVDQQLREIQTNKQLVSNIELSTIQVLNKQITTKILPAKKLVDVQKINTTISNYLKTQSNLNKIGKTEIKPVFLPENTTNTPDYLVADLLYNDIYYYETKKISLNPDYSIMSITDRYITKEIDNILIDIGPLIQYIADSQIDAVFATCNTDIPSAVDAVNEAARTAREAGYKVKTLLGTEATVQAYKYWLGKPNVKIFGNVGHGSPEGINLADGNLEYTYFNTLGESTLNNKVIYLNSCSVHNYPLEQSITNTPGVQKFIGGNINLGIGTSERVFKRFFELTLSNRNGITESLSQAERDTSYSPLGAHGVSGNGSNYLTNANLAPQGTIISSVTNPSGGGNHNIGIIRDGINPAIGSDDSSTQFDTFTGNTNIHYEYIGYTFNKKFTFDKLIFQEGKHFWDGGWFANGAPTVQVRQNGVWYSITSTPTTTYPNSNSQADFGSSYQYYTYNLNNFMGDGIRIYGRAGGVNNFISVGEIQVFEGNQGNIIANVTNPTGTGSKNIEIINDAVTPSVGNNDSNLQYDTFVGNTSIHNEYVGYTYNCNKTFTKLTFQEGKHFWDGGWFSNGTPQVQVRKNGVWTTVTPVSVSPAYPNNNSTAAFGSSYETYKFNLNNEVGNGIRIIGRAGGCNNFISVGELTVLAK